MRYDVALILFDIYITKLTFIALYIKLCMVNNFNLRVVTCFHILVTFTYNMYKDLPGVFGWEQERGGNS